MLIKKERPYIEWIKTTQNYRGEVCEEDFWK
jgi:hypothetical protein